MRKRKNRYGLSLVELIIAFAIIVIIFAAIVPQFRAIRKSWSSTEARAEIIQNGRVLAEHITRNLSAAKQIVSFTSSSITFWDNNDIQKRYKLSDFDSGKYVVFGAVDSEEPLAGPVSSFQISCYSIDPNVALTTDCNIIRLVQVDTDFTNNDVPGANKTFTTSAYLQTNANVGSGLVGWWKLDETSGTTAADSSGSGNNGTLYNMTSPGCWVAGQIGNALNFDGSNDYVNCGNGSSLLITGDLTIAAWVQLTTGNSGNYYGIAGKLHDATDSGFALVRSSTNYFYFWVGNGTMESVSSNTTYTDTDWHHVVGVRRNGTNYLYVDGVQQTATTTRSLSDSGSWAFIGRQYDDYNLRYFNGIIDDVRVYNRALTAAEIARLASTLKYMTFSEKKVSSDSNTTIVIQKPSGTAENDLLIAAVATDGSSTPFTGVPAGWMPIDCTANGTAVTLGAWWKKAGDPEPASYNFTWTGGQKAYGWMMRFTGQDTTSPSPINDSSFADSSGTANPTSPPVDTTVGCSMILRLGAFDDDYVTTTPEPGVPGLSGHTAITMDKSGGSATPVGILGSWVTGTTHAREAGTNRALIFIAHAEDNDDPSIVLSSVSYGGRAMTKVMERVAGGVSPSSRTYVAVFRLNEAGVAAATSSTFSLVTWNQTPDDASYESVFLQNVNQTTPVGATANNGVTTGATITTAALATSSGDLVIDAATCSNIGSYTTNNGFTEALEVAFLLNSTDGVVGYKSATGANETPSVTHSTSNGRQSLIGFVMQSVGVIGTVSGGAGYVRQSTAGPSSGTPTFSLLLAKEARMITIAIAPDSNSQDVGGGGEIRP
jgi:Tfp pilus assembly protein PilE